MDGPGPSTQANAAARARRASRRALGEAAASAQERQRASFPQRQPGGDEESDGEDDDDDNDDSGDENDDDNGEDKPPVYHYKIWKKLQRKGSMGGLLRYVNRQPDSGSHPLDLTAVHSAQITWDLTDRRFWPRILTLWERPLPWNNPKYEIGVMKYKGRVVIDCDDKPIRNFRNLPLTISSKVEGLRLEAWLRADTRITFPDIAARMWTEWSPKDKKMVPKYRHRALSKRPSNARTRCGLISWLKKKGREAQTEYMDSFRTDAQRMANLGVGRDLTAHEKARYSLLGLNERKESEAPTRRDRIDKIKRVAALGDTPAAATPTAGGDDEDLAEDTDMDEAVQEAQSQDQGVGDDTDDDVSVSSSLLDPLDSRNDEPMGPGEEALLEDALGDTVEHFISLTGQEPVLTHPGDNYFSQWGMLQEQLRTLWEAGGNAIEVPRLRARDRWTGGISQYHLAELIEGEEDDESDLTQEEDA